VILTDEIPDGSRDVTRSREGPSPRSHPFDLHWGDWQEAARIGVCSGDGMRWEGRLSPDKRDERDGDAAEVIGVARASRAAGAGAGGGPSGTPADPALLTALTSLAARTRELVQAVVLSDAAIAELGAAAAEIGNLAARLGARRRPGPIWSE